MSKLLSGSWLLLLLSCLPALAQDVAVSGRVTSSDDGATLPGVTVQVKGTTRGTTTDASGTYRVNVPANGRLVFSFIGFATQEVVVGNRSTIDVALSNNANNLSEVVVTALGIERDKRTLSYATQEVNGDRLAQKGEPNILNTLQGKIAGVQITGASGEPGSSTNINIRGIQSFTGNNQPLFIVDGIPISNDVDRTNAGPNGTLGGPQSSNRGLDIPPDNIESINVLKGPAAAALYGSRAASGVILITTKSGRGLKKKNEVTVNSGVTFQEVYGLPKYQNDYGQGTLGVFNATSTASWGPKFGSTPTLDNGLLVRNATNPTQLDPTPLIATPTGYQGTIPNSTTYQAYPNNIKDFFNRGQILNNSVNVGGASADGKSNYNVTIANTLQKGVVRQSEYQRTNVSFGGATQLTNKLKVGTSVNYIYTYQRNSLTGNGASAFGTLTAVPRSYDLENLPYQDINGRNFYIGSTENPIWSLEKNSTKSYTDRIIGNVNFSYDIVKGINLYYRAGIDTYTDRRKQIFGLGSGRVPTGGVSEFTNYRQEINSDLILSGQKQNVLLEGLNIEGRVGMNVNQRKAQFIDADGQTLTLPNFFNLSNATVYSNNTSESNSLRRLVGYYAQASLSYNNYAFLEFTGRADHSSTLPASNSTYFYPSISGNVILSDMFGFKTKTLSYLKLRASAAKVGKDADPYLLQTTYGSTSLGNNVASLAFPINGLSGFSIGSRIGSGDNLKPEFTTSYEVGTNIGMFDNRLSFDVSLYSSVSTDMIVNVAQAASTGYTSRTTNVGRMTNKGIEALISGTPIRTKDFRWDVTVNYTLNRNEVTDIIDGVASFNIPGSSFTGTAPSIVKGQPYGVILGNKKPRVDASTSTVSNAAQYNGQYIINATSGLWNPEVSGQNISNPNPNYLASIQNTFRYKGFSLGFLLDTQQGGQIVSFTVGQLRSAGSLYETGVDREKPRIIPGVILQTNADGTSTYVPNNIQVSAQSYWQGFGLQSDLNVYDATRYSLREATFGYELPAKLLSKTPFGSISLTFVGRNLLYFAPGIPIDPEVNTQGAGNIRGLELQSAPNTRNYGANLRLTF
ncbi:SusC/RagA family TonB-linked outer membrane protein [Spirosoma sp. HMF3257]|uniref:SusC/RagA family TonB-linked outer membrane protein n=1 Tax=Spirosoma telluris TaxID=2183553 RepID=A0A327NNW5_9BACT|nr:SusC/RagA family TonB-linked outer membrane protein [Spirosoma telluris]RAI75696.1 SusC/RagA family TonB-linked outer membrane protein [Spirosoma telluris]